MASGGRFKVQFVQVSCFYELQFSDVVRGESRLRIKVFMPCIFKFAGSGLTSFKCGCLRF